MAIGRISGPMLKSDLLREGVNLAFETDLLYLDVVNKRIGVNKSDPEHDLDVNGTTRSTSIEITNLAEIGNITISGNTIDSSTGVLELGTEDTVIYQNKLKIDDIEIQDNEIRSINGSNIEIISDNAVVEIFANTNIYGNVLISGNITTEGDIFIGDDRLEDRVTFNAKLDSDLIPAITNTYDLGSSTKIWKSIYTNTIYTSQAEVSNSITAGSIIIDDIEINNNEIRSISTNTDLILSAPGSGSVKIENFAIKNNAITNVVSNSITVFSSTTNGYFKIDGNRGFVVPTGSNLQRPEIDFREAGMIRFNTDDQRVELFNGVSWGSVAGPQAGINQSQAQDIAVSIALMLG